MGQQNSTSHNFCNLFQDQIGQIELDLGAAGVGAEGEPERRSGASAQRRHPLELEVVEMAEIVPHDGRVKRIGCQFEPTGFELHLELLPMATLVALRVSQVR